MELREIRLQYLNNWQFLLFCTLVAIINKSIISIYYTQLEADKSLYLLFADSYLKIGQFLEPVHLIENNQPSYIFNPAIISPLYSILALPALSLTKSFLHTSYIIDVAGWIIFFTGLVRLSGIFFQNKALTSILILITGFFIFPHQLASTPKDSLAIGLLFWCIYFILKFRSRKKQFAWHSILISCLLVAFASAKFLYTPLVPILLLILIYGSYGSGNPYHLKFSILIAILTIVASFIFYGFLFNQPADQITDLNPLQSEFIRGFYPGNLRQFFPFISSSIFNINFLSVQLEKLFNKPYSAFYRIFQLLDLLILVTLIVKSKWIYLNIIRNHRIFINSQLLICTVILSLLVLMSLIHKPVNYTGNFSEGWTYVNEERSYLFITIFIQLILVYVIYRTSIHLILKILILSLLMLESIHGIYFTTKLIAKNQIVSNTTPVESVVSYMKKWDKSHPEEKAILITNDTHLRWYALLQKKDAFTYSNTSNCNDWMLPDRRTVFLVTRINNSNSLPCRFEQFQEITIGHFKLIIVPPKIIPLSFEILRIEAPINDIQ